MEKGHKMSNEQKKKLSESAKRNVNNPGRFKNGHPKYFLRHTEESKRKIGLKNSIKSLGNKNRLGCKVTVETREKISKSRLGKVPWNKNKKNIYSKDTLERMSKVKLGKRQYIMTDAIREKLSIIKKGKPFSEEHRKNLSNANRGKHGGDKNPRWKGGITPENNKIRTSIEYSLWKESVFARDNWTCQKYNIKGGTLHSHHIKNFSDYPELRFAIDNGITFSKKAHDEFHKKYGYRNNTKEQIKEFLNS